jgi:predicted small lipoprotein YifL
MNRVLLTALPSLLVLGALAACGTAGPTSASTTTTSAMATTTTTTVPAGPPPVPEPAADGQCPYLPSSFVQEANGQLVRKVRLSADQPNPACFFYANASDVQLSVWVFEGDPKTAKAVVDRAAPVADSSPATAPAGWNGGSLTTDTGAVYAVAKDGNAVVVTSNQKQTIKARRVVETVVTNLGL